MSNNLQELELLLDSNELVLAKKILDNIVQKENPLSLYTEYLIAIYRIRQCSYDLAIPYLVNIISNAQEDVSLSFQEKAYKLLCYCFIKQSRFLEARNLINDLEDTRDCDIKNMEAFISLKLNSIKKAMNIYKEVLGIDESNITAKNGLASIFLEVYDDSKSALDLLKYYDKNDPIILDTLGWAYFHSGDLKEAENYLRRALDQMPENAEINKHLTVVVSCLG